MLSVTLPVMGFPTRASRSTIESCPESASGTSPSDPISYTITVNNSPTANPNLTAAIPAGNTSLKLHIDDNGDNIHGDMVFELYNDLTPTPSR